VPATAQRRAAESNMLHAREIAADHIITLSIRWRFKGENRRSTPSSYSVILNFTYLHRSTANVKEYTCSAASYKAVAKASSYAKPTVIFACSNMCVKLTVLMVSCAE
jgi:hypothetical protein